VAPQEVILPFEEEILPREEAMLPAEEEIFPREEEMLPREEEILPSEEEMSPSEEEMLPREEAMLRKTKHRFADDAPLAYFAVTTNRTFNGWPCSLPEMLQLTGAVTFEHPHLLALFHGLLKNAVKVPLLLEKFRVALQSPTTSLFFP
jgi:hypothetical protein